MKKAKLVSTFRLRGRPGRVLGDLEAEIMRVIWRRGSASIREVWDEVKIKRRPLAFNTVMTVMNRLVEKGLLRREDRRRHYRYRPALDRLTFQARASHEVAEALIHEFGDVAVAQFVEVLEEVDPEKLAALERLILERRGKKT